jgi:hypothetical protein
MLRRRFSWKTDDAEEEVPRKIGDAEEEVDFSFARKINDLKPIIPLSSFLASLNLLRPKTLQASQGGLHTTLMQKLSLTYYTHNPLSTTASFAGEKS